LILDFSEVPLLDSTVAATLDGFARKAARAGAVLYVTGVTKPVRRARITHGIRPPRVRFRTDITAAIAFARRHLNTPSARD
jgi:sulfate permease, SulP family